ncbi:hypothetical protein DL96DRAFT_1717745 [Flagelloscypha sp. PMI_526]|nr:hypothetical protein DL96DRAFT_1717745 [Flagelloscypha sp. PMI_526]
MSLISPVEYTTPCPESDTCYVCAYPLSGQYGPGPRICMYMAIFFGVLGRNWSATRGLALSGVLVTSLVLVVHIFSMTIAFHMANLPSINTNRLRRIQEPAIDMDIFGASFALTLCVLSVSSAVVSFRTYLDMAKNKIVFFWILFMLSGCIALWAHLSTHFTRNVDIFDIVLPLVPVIALLIGLLLQTGRRFERGVGSKPFSNCTSAVASAFYLWVCVLMQNISFTKLPFTQPTSVHLGIIASPGPTHSMEQECSFQELCSNIPTSPLRDNQTMMGVSPPDFLILWLAADFGILMCIFGFVSIAYAIKHNLSGLELLTGDIPPCIDGKNSLIPQSVVKGVNTIVAGFLKGILVITVIGSPTGVIALAIFSERLLQGPIVGCKVESMAAIGQWGPLAACLFTFIGTLWFHWSRPESLPKEIDSGANEIGNIHFFGC